MKMNAELPQRPRSSSRSLSEKDWETPALSVSAAPTHHSRWTMKYDEQWMEWFAMSHLRKSDLGQMDQEKPLPRVWNTPGGF